MENKDQNLVESKPKKDDYITAELNDAMFKFASLEKEAKEATTIAGKPRSLLSDIVKRFCKNYIALISLILIIAILISCITIPAISPFGATAPISNANIIWLKELPPSYNPIVTESLTQEYYEQISKFPEVIVGTPLNVNGEWLITYNKLEFIDLAFGVSSKPLLGTNIQGYDIWTRTWTATRDSIVLAFLVATTDAIIGITVGCILGFYAGKWVDTILSRVIDVIINIPSLVWFLMLMTIVGRDNINQFTLYLILCSIGWVYMVNQARLWMITVKDQEFILAAKAVGCSTQRQIFVHGLPMIIGKLATNYVRRIVIVILSVSSLVFLGFLDSSSDPNLGTLLKEAIPLLDSNFWGLLLPSIILLTFSLSAQFVANGLHDALDPKVGRGK